MGSREVSLPGHRVCGKDWITDLKANKMTVTPSTVHPFVEPLMSCFHSGLLYHASHERKTLPYIHFPKSPHQTRRPLVHGSISLFTCPPILMPIQVLALSLQPNKHSDLSQILRLVSLLVALSPLHCGFATAKQLLWKQLSWFESSLKTSISLDFLDVQPKQCLTWATTAYRNRLSTQTQSTRHSPGMRNGRVCRPRTLPLLGQHFLQAESISPESQLANI